MYLFVVNLLHWGVFMIKTEKEYLEAKCRLEQESKTLEKQKKKMKAAGLSDKQIKLAIDPLVSFTLQLREEVEEYEKLKGEQPVAFVNQSGLGRTLIALRIRKGITQKNLAKKLGVPEQQVSRDERNEYHGASIEKIQKVLNILNVTMTIVRKKHSNTSKKSADRTAGVIFLELEKLFDELIDKHEFQIGDCLYWLYGHLKIHRPDAIEEYTDGGHPNFYYGPKESK